MIPIRREWSAMKRLAILSPALATPTVEDTATGNPLTFQTDLARPLKSLLIPFSPIQSGTGDPSPENIRPILPWNGLSAWSGGKNLLPENAVEYGSYNTTGEKTQDGNNKYRRLSVNLPAGNFIFSTDTPNCYIIRLLVNDSVVGAGGASQTKKISLTKTSTIKLSWRNTDTSEITGTLHNQIEVGQTATAYEPYKPITDTDIVFPSPVYGGTLDVVSGVMTVNRICITKKWSEWTQSTPAGSSFTRKILLFDVPVKGVETYAWAKCNVAPQEWSTNNKTHFYINENRCYLWLPNETSEDLEIQIGATLVTPQETQLTPVQITAIVGDNTIWSDANGSMTAVYLKKK